MLFIATARAIEVEEDRAPRKLEAESLKLGSGASRRLRLEAMRAGESDECLVLRTVSRVTP